MASESMIWDRFELLGEIKRGGMGIVYKAFDRERQVLAAVKMVRVADKKLIQSIRREIRALERVNHPGVVGILGEGVFEGMPWYAMEFLDARTLLEHCHSVTSAHLSRNEPATSRDSQTGEDGTQATMATTPSEATQATQLTSASHAAAIAAPANSHAVPDKRPPLRSITPEDLKTVLSLIRQLCVPLSYIHGEGLVHLDLKPDNILIRRSGLPVLLDFGLATVVRSTQGRDALGLRAGGAGTVRYMAPEQINGDLVDARADMYALGCILYQLLTGQVPFPGPSAAETIFGQLNLKPLPPSSLVAGIPLEVDELVLRMLAKKPRDRIGYAQDIDRALEQLGAEGWHGNLPSARDYVYQPRLAGREKELALLTELFNAHKTSGSHIVLLGGESGIGKTRLVGEFAHTVEQAESSPEVFVGEFIGQSRPLQGFKRILESIVDTCRELTEEERSRILGKRALTLARYEPDFRWFCSEQEPAAELLPDAARQLLFQDFYAVLGELSKKQPLVLILDDIQWADDLSLGFVEYIRVMSQTAPLPIIILATHRTGEPNIPLEELAARPGVVRLSLGRLDLSAVGALIADMLAIKQVSTTVAESLYQHSEGNPLFLTEYLLESVSAGLVRRRADGTWQALGGASQEIDYARLPLPNNVSELIQRRLGSLSSNSRHLAELAAVMGEEPSLDILSSMFHHSDAALYDALDELQRRHVLSQKSPQVLAFAHGKIREATYAQLNQTNRQQLHLQVGRALSFLPEDHPLRSDAVIADHFYQGQDEATALPYALRAGDNARALYGHDEAERFYLRAIATMEHTYDVEGVARTQMKLGLTHMAAFATEKARAVYEAAFRTWERLRVSSRTARRTESITVATGEPISLDPGRTYDTDSAFLQRQLFACLVEVDEETNVLPAVAERWQISSDGRIYTFHLRPDSRWSDGTPLSARHFEFAWKRNLSPQLGSAAAPLLDIVEGARSYRLGNGSVHDVGVRAKGAHVLEIKLAAPVGYLLQLLSHPITAPQPSWLIEARGNNWASPDHIVTNGAYKVVRWLHGQLIQLEHNRHDIVWSRGNVQELHCRIFNDYRDALKAYNQGELDLLDMVSANTSLIAELRQKYADELNSVPIQSITYLVFRTDRPPFSDQRVRRAFAHALDRSRLASVANQIGAQPATGGFIPPGVPAHSPELMLSHKPDMAKELLAAAGSTAADFSSVSWLHTHGIADPAILEVLRDSWSRTLGVELAPQVLRWRDYQSRVDAGVPDLLIGTWTADFFDPDNFLRAVFHSTTGLNEPKWKNTEFDMLVDTAASRTDQSGRMNFYRAADRVLVVDEAVIVPLCYGREPVLVKPWVESFPRTASWLRHMKNCRVQKVKRSGGFDN